MRYFTWASAGVLLVLASWWAMTSERESNGVGQQMARVIPAEMPPHVPDSSKRMPPDATSAVATSTDATSSVAAPLSEPEEPQFPELSTEERRQAEVGESEPRPRGSRQTASATPARQASPPTRYVQAQATQASASTDASEADRARSGRALRDSIRSSFREQVPSMRECYELLLELSPEVEDRLVFELVVTPNDEDAEHGLVELVSISTETLVLEDVACFSEVMADIQLPPPADGQLRISYPIVLRTADDSDETE